jgi:hypothetical protein
MGDVYAAEMDKWHRDARRTAETLFAVSPFQGTPPGFQCMGGGHSCGGERSARHRTASSRRSPLRAGYDAFGSERYVLTIRQPRLTRGGVGGTLRVHRNRGQRPQVRGRRHLQSIRHTYADNAFTPYCSCTSSAPLRRARRRILHVRCRLRQSRRSGPNPGAECDTADPFAAEVEGPAHHGSICRPSGPRRSSADGAGDSRSAGRAIRCPASALKQDMERCSAESSACDPESSTRS